MKTNKQIEQDFLAAEINERNKLVAFVNDFKRGNIFFNNISTPGDYKGYDAAIYSGNTRMLVEVKCRNFGINEYKDAILEKNKIDEMYLLARKIEQTREYEDQSILEYYFCFYTDCVAIWETKQFVNFRNIMCPKTTCGITTKKNKECLVFDFIDAEIIYFKKE